ncbi:MAG: hypothetical protein JJE51_04845 [Thermoanaerobaculia bacterium]|nr:hypothetical protein [Thermoanaerobaculia bacterium]
MQSDSERLIELVNLAADGQATPPQQDELQALVDQSAEARQLEASTRELVARLDHVESVDPPAELRPNVMRRVRSGTAVRHIHTLTRRRRFALAWAAAAALVLLVLLVDRPRRLDDHGATMAPAAEWPAVASLKSGKHTLVIRQKGNLYRLEPAISGSYPVVTTLIWDPKAAVLVAISAGPEASSSVHKAEFTLHGAEDRASVTIRRLGGAPFEIRVEVTGTEVLRTRVPVN